MKNYKIIQAISIFLLFHTYDVCAQQLPSEKRVESLLLQMTLQEKIGQLNQYNDDWEATGPVTLDPQKAEQVKQGLVGSMLNCMGAARTRHWQELAMQSRLKIPLLFGQDVIHGYKTTFPIPLAESCSWDLDVMTLSARIACAKHFGHGKPVLYKQS